MNRRRLLKLADRLDKLKHYRGFDDVLDDGRFNLAAFHFNCGSPACVAGHAEALYPGLPRDTFYRAKMALGLTEDEATKLFLPTETLWTWAGLPRGMKREDVTPKQAAFVIRQFVETGVVSYAGINRRDPT